MFDLSVFSIGELSLSSIQTCSCKSSILVTLDVYLPVQLYCFPTPLLLPACFLRTEISCSWYEWLSTWMLHEIFQGELKGVCQAWHPLELVVLIIWQVKFFGSRQTNRSSVFIKCKTRKRIAQINKEWVRTLPEVTISFTAGITLTLVTYITLRYLFDTSFPTLLFPHDNTLHPHFTWPSGRGLCF